MDWEPAVLEAAQPWEPRFVPQGTVPVTVRCLLSRKQKALRLIPANGQQPQSHRELSPGVPPDATYGVIKAAVTTQSADGGGQDRVGGSTTSQVSIIPFKRSRELTIYFFRKDLPVARQLAPRQLELRGAGDSHPRHLLLGRRCAVIPR